MMMGLEREPNNPYDEHAVTVRAPSEEEMAPVLETITRDHHPIQAVKDVCGQIVGRVPRGIASIISKALEDGSIYRAMAFYRGGFEHGGPVRGGGPQLRAVYCVYLARGRDAPEKLVQLADKLRPFLGPNDIYL